eukprot:TRINITY_DN6140_c0_g1_i1.p1 TRINITY_DN6140_c0_g1~~TRINITY_DN6140_c0_g1_i1.p1  ORF type:complete len:434 (+),score=59.73 TRINITY_DN6140_c0_g1_i1:90-1391(+)
MASESFSDRLLEIFTRFDNDGNGKIIRPEFAKMLKVLGMNFTEAEIDKLMLQVDSGHNGEISFEELCKWLQTDTYETLTNQLGDAAKKVHEDKRAQESPLPLKMGICVTQSGSIFQLDLRTGCRHDEFGTLSERDRYILEHSADRKEIDKAPHLAPPNCIDVHWARQRFVTGSADHTVKLWDFEGNVLKTWHGCLSEVLCVEASFKRRMMVTGGLASHIKIWDMTKSTPSDTFMCDPGGVYCFSVCWDQNRVICGAGKNLQVWDITSKAKVTATSVERPQCLMRLEGHTDQVRGLLADWTTYVAITGSLDKTIRRWDIKGGTLLQTFPCDIGQVCCMSGDLAKGWIVTGDTDNLIKKWHPETGECLKVFKGHADHVLSLSKVRDGFIVSGGRDGTVRVWDLETAECIRTIEVRKEFGAGVFVTGVRAEPNPQA